MLNGYIHLIHHSRIRRSHTQPIQTLVGRILTHEPEGRARELRYYLSSSEDPNRAPTTNEGSLALNYKRFHVTNCERDSQYTCKKYQRKKCKLELLQNSCLIRPVLKQRIPIPSLLGS